MRPNAMTHVPLTRPSHATILSGRLPWELGVRDNLAPAELPPSPLLAEILKGAGFRTARVRFFDRAGAARRIRRGDSIATTTIFRRPRAPTS